MLYESVLSNLRLVCLQICLFLVIPVQQTRSRDSGQDCLLIQETGRKHNRSDIQCLEGLQLFVKHENHGERGGLYQSSLASFVTLILHSNPALEKASYQL